MFEVVKPMFEVKMTPKYLDLPKSIYIYQIILYSKLMKLQQATDNESLWADPAKSDNEYDHHHVI